MFKYDITQKERGVIENAAMPLKFSEGNIVGVSSCDL